MNELRGRWIAGSLTSLHADGRKHTRAPDLVAGSKGEAKGVRECLDGSVNDHLGLGFVVRASRDSRCREAECSVVGRKCAMSHKALDGSKHGEQTEDPHENYSTSLG